MLCIAIYAYDNYKIDSLQRLPLTIGDNGNVSNDTNGLSLIAGGRSDIDGASSTDSDKQSEANSSIDEADNVIVQTANSMNNTSDGKSSQRKPSINTTERYEGDTMLYEFEDRESISQSQMYVCYIINLE